MESDLAQRTGQPITEYTYKAFNTFEEVEWKLESALNTMLAYYQKVSFKPNPTKTQVSSFHLQSGH